MTKHQWKSIGHHIDPEKEEQLKWIKSEIESQVKRVIKLTKSITPGNKEKNTRNKSEAINIVEDFQKQYDSLYALYEDLREQVKKNARNFTDSNSTSSAASNSDEEAFYSPGRAPLRSNSSSKSSDSSSNSNSSNEPDQTSDDTILKDKLTCSSQVKEITDLETLKELRVQEESQNTISPRVKDFKGHVERLEFEISKLCVEKQELKQHLERKSNEATEMKDIISKLEAHVSDIETKLKSDEHSLAEEKESNTSNNHESSQELLQKSLSETENELSTERKKLEDLQTLVSTKSEEIQNLQSELENEKKHKSTEPESRNLDKEKEEFFSPSKFLVDKISKSNIQAVEKKIEEILEEYRKQLDDKVRILSRRIRVAEQLQVENKEWYRKTKEAFEQQNMDLKNRAERNESDLRNIKEVALAANHALTWLDSVALNLEESSANFLNRISKASCELKFAKHWAMRKNRAVLHVKDDLDCLLSQLDDKEAEILVFREKVWRSENKVRELEKTVKERDDGMLGLMEEKREAIRQLCVWIDYHRGRSDHYMKVLSEMNQARSIRKKAS